MTKFFLNFTVAGSGAHVDWLEIDEPSFVKLGAGRVVLATQFGLAVYNSRGSMKGENGDDSEWLQFWIVPVYGLAPADPLAAEPVFTAVEMSEQP